MQIAIPDLETSATLILDREHPLTDEAYYAFCVANPDLRIERMPDGEIVIVPPAGGESDFRSVKAIVALDVWAEKQRHGRAFGSSAQFLLPNGAALSPDAAWVSNERIATLSKRQRQEFLKLVPEFVIEVMSPSDRLAAAKRKMRLWAANGVDLGWLIDGDNRRVYVYRGHGAEPRVVADAESIAGEGPVEGFVLPLDSIWMGL
jgi:Uma2 family endonuclease